MFSTKAWLEKCAANEYAVFYEKPGREYNLNIVGWRNSVGRVNYFDDHLSVYWQRHGKWESLHYPITTRPGLAWLLNPMNEKGTAILVPGQYREAYALGEYKGYTALRQVASVTVFRDDDKDSQWAYNFSKIDTGLFGIHIHRAGIWSKVVGVSSAGCQVFQKKADFEEFIDLCRRAAVFWGNRFTYTLLEF